MVARILKAGAPTPASTPMGWLWNQMLDEAHRQRRAWPAGSRAHTHVERSRRADEEGCGQKTARGTPCWVWHHSLQLARTRRALCDIGTRKQAGQLDRPACVAVQSRTPTSCGRSVALSAHGVPAPAVVGAPLTLRACPVVAPAASRQDSLDTSCQLASY
jgi:hypothetical protein